ncbi:PAS domain S-box protein [Aggregicoccus sp. 17bor-14]|uniref:sensor histidine kinase n=1 Tax=Myxococcaceae TaxID=31 RepID=UPI00129C2CAC|nr:MULTISPECIES: ATP-binding protein [Myxococcaceae]MBF5043069.1 PAS domain S-box protein [Simulacricoccus sp. 17bor-14]MRI88832.1 PAS domain S-box protein [Aggregicoccus sp. 17bor-14]
MGRTWSFAQRVGVGFVTALLIALALAASSVLALRTLALSGRAATLDASEDRLLVEQLRRAFSEKVGASRGYALSGNLLFEEDARVARGDFRRLHAELQRRLVEPPGPTLLAQLATAEAGHEAAVEKVRRAREDGATPGRLRELVGSELQGPRVATELLLSQLSAHVDRHLAAGAAADARATRRALVLVFVSTALGLALAASLGWVLTRPLTRLNQSAHQSEQRFALVVDAVRDYALMLLDAQGRVTHWNAGAQRIHGWREEEVLGQPVSALYPPEAQARGLPARELERTLRDGRLQGESWRLRKDGTRFWAEFLLTPVKSASGQLEGFACVTRDITERKRVERAQRLFAEAGRLFNRALDPDVTVTELARLTVPEVADACILYLVAPGAQSVSAAAIVHAEREQELRLRELVRRFPPTPGTPFGVWQTLDTRRSTLVPEVTREMAERVASDPDERALLEELAFRSFLIVPLVVGERALGALALFSTREERRFSNTDRAFVEELAGRAALALDNARLYREAQEALELIGVAAHDLANPLHMLQLLLSKLRRTDLEDHEKVRGGLMAADKQTKRLGQMLNNLLDLSRSSSGALVLELGELELGELVREVVERSAEQAAEAGVALSAELAPGLVGRWDRLRLDRVVTNLLSNALKFGRGRPVQLRAWGAGGQVYLSVRDRGPGIPADAQARIFGRFQRAPSGEGKAGFGLGLYIVRQLVEAHGGRIRVESVPGEGATFLVELPRDPALAAREGGSAGSPVAGGAEPAAPPGGGHS